MTDTTTLRLETATRRLLPFAGAMIVANAIMQLVIALSGHDIDTSAGVLTAVIALGYAVFLLRWRRALGKVRFGLLATHVVTYAAVNVGFGMHFFALALTDSPAVRADPSQAGDFAMDPGWFGAAMAMPTLWGVGLLMHAVGAIVGRGFEAER